MHAPAVQPESAISESDPIALLNRHLRAAIVAAFGEQFAQTDPAIRASQNPQFGDYQANVAMALSKQVSLKPRDVAERIKTHAPTELAEVAEPLEIAGPGFINIRLKSHALSHVLNEMDNDRLGVSVEQSPYAVTVDLCGVNVSKQMHVGHLRATIIGDALARILERRGRAVHRENHLGDWGLPIAMVLHYLRSTNTDLSKIELTDLDRAYREAQQAGERDPAALEAAKQTLIKLQNHDSELMRDWNAIIEITLRALYEAVELLNVKIGPENNRGESFYREQLSGVVDAFMRAGHAKEDNGAIVVPFADRERPLLIRKSDGGYLYATTDLAAIRYRVQQLNSDRVIYVVDARQRDHFRDVFDAARLIGWDRTADGTRAELTHIGFGAVLGDDKKPLKTRSGENVTLKSLLTEAVERGVAEVKKRAADPAAPTHGLPDEQLHAIGKAVGIGAVKYADLSNDLVRDYVFNFDRMIAFEGNTGPYLQYAHARICSIFAKAGLTTEITESTEKQNQESLSVTSVFSVVSSVRSTEFMIRGPAERQLALMLLRYGGTVADVARTLEPHRLCTYLYDLANTFSTFYQECPVLKADEDAIRRSRLRLCDMVRRVLADGLNLLGIEAPHRM